MESVSQLDYSNTAAPRHSYTPYETRSHAHSFRLSDDVTEAYIGGDLEPRESLRHVATTRNGIRYQMGASRDGVGVDRLVNYMHDLRTQDDTDPYELDGKDFYPFRAAPKLFVSDYFLGDRNAAILAALMDSIRLLNDALPPEFQIQYMGAREDDGEIIYAYPGEIVAILDSATGVADNCGDTAVACATSTFSGDNTSWAFLRIPDDFDVSEYTYPRSVIVHELLHALGISGHVDSVEFPDSIMGTSGEYIPNLGHVISRIDREVLQIMYMSQRSDLYNDWGEWSDTTFHLVGRTDDGNLNFGVALFNGLPQPWVRGVLPDTDLVDNRRLYGTATWNGNLLGFSGPSPIAGDAALEVRLATVVDPENEQDLRFRDIYFLNRFESESSDRWFHTRDIDYKVNVSGNGFQNVRGEGFEQGHVTGVFLGPEHEHMGGTLKRTDMVAAFGGRRTWWNAPNPGAGAQSSVTQSSNSSNGMTTDSVTTMVEYDNGQINFLMSNGSAWSISDDDTVLVRGNATVGGIEFNGVELRKSIADGTLWLDVYSDIEAPVTQGTDGGGESERLEDGMWTGISGLTQDEINARMGDGELDGVPGTFSCDRADGATCPAFDGTHLIASQLGDWIFIPSGSGETVTDADYLSLGRWVYVPNGETDVTAWEYGVFADGADPFHAGNLRGVTGSATYRGAAAGVAVDSREPEETYWRADATLTAEFGTSSELGTIGGTIRNFSVEGSAPLASAPSVVLDRAPIVSSNSGSFTGNVSLAGHNDIGKWGGRFFGDDEPDGKPGSVAGTFGFSDGDGVSFFGAFGAHKQ